MKTKLCVVLVFAVFCLPIAALAHKPLLSVEDNGDGTIYVETGFSDGSSGAGHTIILKAKDSGDVLSETKIPAEGYIEELPMPSVPYTVSFDAGPGHVVIQDGPFAEGAAEAAAPAEEPAEAAPATGEDTTATAAQATTAPAAAAAPAPAAAAAVPAAPVAQLAPQAVAPVQQAMPMMAASPSAMSPGVERSLNMMMTSQMVFALAALVILGAVMFLLGYSLGKDVAKTRSSRS
ncbi:hypothetical protein CSB45_07200 [candidate division KSB3 bacterium]|uniref:CopC domain-containing protein n=1 Tax=candidate division KSB3 bacterium TaxID=2044937 RepID=A0A2G6E6B1_9BACT|nr:MAG: hypothetical protein CSB45_07200 [candidate division KSB3 bacterium]PIE29984.1 MAG: hypothetical protein CSA57_05395 [candidate division KSB3 bacterium]